MQNEREPLIEPTRHVNPLRLNTAGGSAVPDHCEVVVEEVLTMAVDGAGNIAVMCTPTDVVALTVGFLFGEGLITGMEDIETPTAQTDPLAVAVRVKGALPAEAGRNLIVTSSCGMCGSRNIEDLRESLEPAADSLRISPTVLREVAEQMRTRQTLFAQTGGTHAAAIFAEDGEIIAMGEDIGRHNALDKAVGKCLLEGLSLKRRGVMLSGRISLEMLAKAGRAGLEIVAAVSAPTSMAVDVAQQCNITLCGFVRADRATVYTHPHRIR